MNDRISMLVYCVREAGGHRFRQTNHCKYYRSTIYHYYSCCQDENQFSQTKSNGKRDRSQMKRFPCQSKLVFKTDFLTRRLNVSLQHIYHTPYVDIRLSQEAVDYVNSHSDGHTPAEMFRNLQSSRIPGVELIAQHQIYYQWQRANSSTWRRDSDQFVSATKLLNEYESVLRHVVYFSGKLRGLAIYFNGTMSALVSGTQELVIDATYGTNSSGNTSTNLI